MKTLAQHLLKNNLQCHMLGTSTTSSTNSNIMIKYLTRKNGYFSKEYKQMTMMQCFKQYYTPQKYSQYIMQQLSYLQPKRVMDLAIGRASLLKEAISEWQDAKYFGNDIDQTCCNKIRQETTLIECFNEDIFKYSTINKLLPHTEPIDLCLGNPPFDLITQNGDTRKILNLFKLDTVYKSKKVPAELIFILQCIRITSRNGIIALILPDGFFVNKYFRLFRKFLVENYDIKKIVELPNNIFAKTEAKTHILIFKKQISEKSHVVLSSTEKFKQNIAITKQESLDRMDYNYYANLKEHIESKCIQDFDIKLIRGKPKYKLSEIHQNYILHTTSFSKKQSFSNRLKSEKKLFQHKGRIAKEGDIVLARVGSYCLGNVGIVKKGYFVATDCIFIIRVNNETLRKKLFSALKSFSGRNWIKTNAKGVAAKHITLEDIKKFPLDLK